jgi:hypothetical protein
LATKSRPTLKENEAGGACSRRETKSSGGADQRGLGEHDSRNEKEKQKSVLAPTELRNRLWNLQTKEMKREKGVVLARESWRSLEVGLQHPDARCTETEN